MLQGVAGARNRSSYESQRFNVHEQCSDSSDLGTSRGLDSSPWEYERAGEASDAPAAALVI